MRRLPPIDPETWDTAEALSTRTGIPVKLHYDTLAKMTYVPNVAERIVWHLKASPWRLLIAEGLLVVAVACLVFALTRLD
ncbi:MAG TPA: hypothetical protein VM470_03795 [Acidimicrobiia bacterium]|nr:hypothetical protein [Acidimicrobiia bacterium]